MTNLKCMQVKSFQNFVTFIGNFLIIELEI